MDFSITTAIESQAEINRDFFLAEYFIEGAMASLFSIDDVECFGDKLEWKDSNDRHLFREKTGQAPFQVTRVFKQRIGNEKEQTCFVQNVDVLNNGQLKALRHVCVLSIHQYPQFPREIVFKRK